MKNENSFLNNLKNAVDTGEFNSEAAKKINEIYELANSKTNASELINKRIGENVKTVSKEEAAELNSEYEKKIKDIELTDLMNKQLATLIEIEEMVELTISDMIEFTDENLSKFKKEFEEKNPIFVDLEEKITKIRTKYNTFINK